MMMFCDGDRVRAARALATGCGCIPAGSIGTICCAGVLQCSVGFDGYTGVISVNSEGLEKMPTDSKQTVPSEPGYYWAKCRGSIWQIVQLMYDDHQLGVFSVGSVCARTADNVLEWGPKVERDKVDERYGLETTWDTKVFKAGSCWKFVGGKFGPEGQIGIVDKVRCRRCVLDIITLDGGRVVYVDEAVDMTFVPLVEKEVE